VYFALGKVEHLQKYIKPNGGLTGRDLNFLEYLQFVCLILNLYTTCIRIYIVTIEIEKLNLKINQYKL